MFSARSLETAFRSGSGEYAWTLGDIPNALADLHRAQRAVLGGEAWLVVGTSVYGAIPCPTGPPGVFSWTCEPLEDESWEAFVDRSNAEAAAAVLALGVEKVASVPSGGRILYNLTWLPDHD